MQSQNTATKKKASSKALLLPQNTGKSQTPKRGSPNSGAAYPSKNKLSNFSNKSMRKEPVAEINQASKINSNQQKTRNCLYIQDEAGPQFEPFFDRFIPKGDFQFTKPTPERLRLLEDLYDSPDACSIFEVSTDCFSKANGRQKNNRDGSLMPIDELKYQDLQKINIPFQEQQATEDYWDGQPRLFNCILCKNILFLFEPTVNTDDTDQILNDLKSFTRPIGFLPLYCCSVELAQLRTIRQDKQSALNQPPLSTGGPELAICQETQQNRGASSCMRLMLNQNTLLSPHCQLLRDSSTPINGQSASCERVKVGFILTSNGIEHRFVLVKQPSHQIIEPEDVSNQFQLPQQLGSKISKEDMKQQRQIQPNEKIKSSSSQFRNKSNISSSLMEQQRLQPLSSRKIDQTNAICSNKLFQAELDTRIRLIKSWIKALDQWVVRLGNKLRTMNVLEEIGAGSQGQVYRVEKNIKRSRCDASFENYITQEYMALKVIKKSKLNEQSEEMQSQILKEVRGQRTLKLCGSTTKIFKIHECSEHLSLLMELQEGGCLTEVVQMAEPIFENQVKLITAQILLSIDFMQRKKIIHRDLKPSNILLYSAYDGIYDIRIADFGFSISLDDLEAEYEQNPDMVCGTPGYMSPECLNYQGYGLQSDIFSAGCILYNLLTQRNLFFGQDYREVVHRNKECDLKQLRAKILQKKRTEDSADLCELLLTKDSKQRPSAEQALHHRWFGAFREGIDCSLKLNKILTETQATSVNIDKCLIGYATLANMQNDQIKDQAPGKVQQNALKLSIQGKQNNGHRTQQDFVNLVSEIQDNEAQNEQEAGKFKPKHSQ
ncbi:hypothetical protein FGO68_gene10518 [Halteria grandinella]|uniref:Protein kinase domain-containing protein n=1 Tax=Halteria grandinella TaxID=5974 RepID=A0A8J8P2U8_HALGN|nr:hypothetical protein FGO68_gene10518 [Halteria grandinella]